eukprot:Tamp_07865.p1 GENE.Tamp_07865~~Tamp_07865.p1  ORF type:complete len:519 (-),score=143.83 Tamp_07865:117-1673(-)
MSTEGGRRYNTSRLAASRDAGARPGSVNLEERVDSVVERSAQRYRQHYPADPFDPDSMSDEAAGGSRGVHPRAPKLPAGTAARRDIAPTAIFEAGRAGANAAAARSTPEHATGRAALALVSAPTSASEGAVPRVASCSDSESSTSQEVAGPPCKKQRVSGKKSGARGGPRLKQIREHIKNDSGYQTLSQYVGPENLGKILDLGLRFEGRGLDHLFVDGPFSDFCETIAKTNKAPLPLVKKSKLKRLKTWDNRDNVYYHYSGPGDVAPENLRVGDMCDIKLTVKGKHSLLMYIDTENDGLPHTLENMCVDEASDVITKLFEFSRSLPSRVQTVIKETLVRKETHEKSKQQMREQIKIMQDKNSSITEKQALNRLRGDAQILYQGLLPPKKNPDGTTMTKKDGTPKKHTATEMVMMANPKIEKKQQVHSRTIVNYANEPILDAQKLQRSAVTYLMRQGKDHVQAHKEVAESNGINLMALFGLDKEKDEEKRLQKLAELSFNRDEGIKHFGRQQQQLQIEA